MEEGNDEGLGMGDDDVENDLGVSFDEGARILCQFRENTVG